MKPSKDIRPISYLKAHAAEMIGEITETRDAVIITQRGAATAVLVDVRSYEDLQDSLAFLKILARSRKSMAEGRSTPLAASMRRVRARGRKLLGR